MYDFQVKCDYPCVVSCEAVGVILDQFIANGRYINITRRGAPMGGTLVGIINLKYSPF